MYFYFFVTLELVFLYLFLNDISLLSVLYELIPKMKIF